MAKWPPDRVAIHPPRVEYSKLCGKCRNVRPCGLSWSSRDGPKAPASTDAARDTGSTSMTLERLRRSRLTAALCLTPSTRGSTPPHTLDPPPKGVSEAPTEPAQSMTAEISDSLRG